MEFVEKLGDWITSVFAVFLRITNRFFKSSNERRIKQIGFNRDKDGNTAITPDSLLAQINALEPEWQQRSDSELLQTAGIFRERLAAGETLDDLLPDCFAAVRESGRRYLKMRHYDVQMIGGYFLHHGMIAEMVTGEGKTLVATLPAFLNALQGHVHAITVNDYLALRDMEWMGPIYINLGMTVGAIQAQMPPHERQEQYACDITYGTNNEFGFDYLRDNMKPTADLQVQGQLNFAIIDEIDNILIDESRTPLIISGPAHDDISKYPKANRIALQLKRDVDFEFKEKEHTCHMTEDGIRHGEELAGVDSFYTVGNMEWPHLIDNALKAHHLYKRDVNYVVERGAVVIVDEFTGRKMEGRQWSDGLHQAVEAKEGVTIKEETQTLATITLQKYFMLYKKLCGMTGTALTEANEFWKTYKLDVVAVPTNRPLMRINHTDVIYCTEKEKWTAVVDEIRAYHGEGRPVLVGTTSIEQSELVSNRLGKFGVQHNVLNAKHHEREAEYIAQAGRKGAVTIATNMAGRGTDIILGGNPEHLAWEELKQKHSSRLDVSKAEWDDTTLRIAEQEGMLREGEAVAKLGGLHVVGTERHDSRRIDLQLRGRSGRQGDPGSSRFFLSLEDKLMRLFASDWVRNMLQRIGMEDGEAIEHPMVSKRIEGAQKKVEEKHSDQRKHLLEYDEVMDEQRKSVYSYRQRILEGGNCRHLILDMIRNQIDHWGQHFLEPDYRWNTIAEWAGQELRLDVNPQDVRDMDREQIEQHLLAEARYQAESQINEQLEECLPEETEDKRDWNWLSLSRWSNSQFGLNTNDRELKKLGREDVCPYLIERAHEAISRQDFSTLEVLLDPLLPKRSLSNWLLHQFTMEVDPSELESEESQELIETIVERVEQMYEDKERNFPVAVGMAKFLSTDQTSAEKHDRQGLVNWANSRFQTNLTLDDFKSKNRQETEDLLTESSRRHFADNGLMDQIDGMIEQAYGDEAADQPSPDDHQRAVEDLAEWSNAQFQTQLKSADLLPLDEDEARQTILSGYDTKFRPEMSQAERSLILEILDTSWKDHLYYMDHLRSGIGLVGYAQKDPKVEYKREGRKAFNSMWDRVSEQVTNAIFRIEQESPMFVGSLWEITATTHEEASSDFEQGLPESTGPEPGAPPTAIDPIVNRDPKVGRNSPCPCGSGKKFKKCCGR